MKPAFNSYLMHFDFFELVFESRRVPQADPIPPQETKHVSNSNAFYMILFKTLNLKFQDFGWHKGQSHNNYFRTTPCKS